jgi:release factor glutamine methyltransferase
VQHLTGEQAFRRLTLEVRPGVFIPRPETEVLVGVALESINDMSAPLVVDVGTGTGAIALSIKDERPSATVFAIDRSVDAVGLARANAERLGLDVAVLEGDMLSPLPPELMGRIDLVVSNPPYVTEDEFEGLPDDVRADPASAVVGDPDVYERLARAAHEWLRSGGGLVVEVDERRAGDVVDVFGRVGFVDVGNVKDLTGRDRVVQGRRP